MSWIVVPNWERFQHYKDRDPAWIKLYTELNSRADWLHLGVAERGLLCTVWVEFARSRGVLQRSQVQALCKGSARTSHWESLNRAGFIVVSASKPLAFARSREEDKSKKRGRESGAKEPPPTPALAEEPERDPEALRKIRELASTITKGGSFNDDVRRSE